tara:strand:- start:136 stop:360 length:225 start_codon:yes stop_codon:yes gene_type:complete
VASNYNPDSVNAVLSRIEQKLEDISTEIKEIKTSENSLEKRINILENFKYYLLGFAAFFILSVEYLRNLFTGKS